MDCANKKHSRINSLFLSHPSAAVKKKTHSWFSQLFLPTLVADPQEKAPPRTMTVGVYSVVLLRTQKIDWISTDLSALTLGASAVAVGS